MIRLAETWTKILTTLLNLTLGSLLVDILYYAMLDPIQMGTNMSARNQQKHLSLSFATKA